MKAPRYSSLKSFVNHFDFKLPVSWEKIFGRCAPLEVEIGFGTGEYLVRLAQENPKHNFVGIEENVERIHKTLRKIELDQLENVRLLRIDARLAMARCFSPRSIEHIHCLFPCPWPKKNQVKHRLFSRDFLKLLNNRLVSDGKIDLVTDFSAYHSWVKRQVAQTGFKMTSETIAPRFNTKFERKWRAAGQEKFFASHFKKEDHVKRPSFEEIPLKVYFFDHFDPRLFKFEDQTGELSVVFKEFIFDEQRRQGMVHLVVSEDHLSQHLWIKILKTAQKGWCIAIADGSLVIPTEGAAKALELVHHCAQQTKCSIKK